MTGSQSGKPRNAVLLIDLENLVGGGVIKRPVDPIDFVRAVRTHYAEWVSEFAIARAYANWADSYHSAFRKSLHKADIDPVQIFQLAGRTDNAADAEMIVDSISIAYERPELDVFVMATADGAFTAAAVKLHELGRTVLGVSCSDPSEYLVEACDLFAFFDFRTNKIRAVESSGPSFGVAKPSVPPLAGAAPRSVAAAPKPQLPPAPPPTPVPTGPYDGDAKTLFGTLLEALVHMVARRSPRGSSPVEYSQVEGQLKRQIGYPWREAAKAAGVVGRTGEALRISTVLAVLVPSAQHLKTSLIVPPGWSPSSPLEPGALPTDQVRRIVEDFAAASCTGEGFVRMLSGAVGAAADASASAIADAAETRLAGIGLTLSRHSIMDALATVLAPTSEGAVDAGQMT